MIKMNTHYSGSTEFEFTKTELTACWECGGGFSSTGKAQLVASADGGKIKPIYIRTRGQLACDNHALFVVQLGDLIVQANHHRFDFNILIGKIVKFEIDQFGRKFARLNSINYFSQGEWETNLTENFVELVKAAKNKATDYHCRSVYWAKSE